MLENSQKSALVVEDHDVWRADLAAQLERMGFRVLRAEDAETAIELLDRVPNIRLLVLDWDLRGKVSLPTAQGEDVLITAREKGKSLRTIIVTGAIDNPEYLSSRHASADDELWTILKYRPFAVLRKKDLTMEQETGFSSLWKTVLEANLLDPHVPDKAGGAPLRLTFPVQFHWPTSRLVDKKGNYLALPPKLGFVIREMLARDPSNPKRGSTRRELAYADVAERYIEGWAVQNLKRLHDERELHRIIQEKGAEIAERPEKIAQQWAREFRRFLRKQGVQDANAVLQCCKMRGMYTLGSGWNHETPVIDRGEVGFTARSRNA